MLFTDASTTDPAAPRRSEQLLAWCDRHRGWLLLAVIALYAIAFNTHWRPHSDSALHLSIARNIVEGHGFIHPTGHEVRLNPGLAYLLAGPMWLIGDDQLWLSNLLMMGLGLAALAVAYRLFRVTADRPTAVLLTALLAVSLTFFGHTLVLLTDIPFLLGGLLFLLGWAHWSERGALHWRPVALMVVGAAIMVLFRTVAITFLGAAALALAGYAWQHRRLKRVWVSCVALVAVVIAGLALAAVTSSGLSGATRDAAARPSDDLTLILHRLSQLDTAVTEHLPANLALMFTDNLAVAVFGVNFGPAVNVVLALTVLAGALTLVRRQPLWALLILAFVVQMLLFLSERRYFLVLLPLLLMGWWHAALWLERRLPARWGAYALVTMVALWTVPNFVRSVDQVIEQRQRPYLASVSDGKYDDLHRLSAQLEAHMEPDALAATAMDVDRPVLGFWSNRALMTAQRVDRIADFDGPMYVLLPADAELQALIESRGWSVNDALFRLEPQYMDQPAWSLHRVSETGETGEASLR